MESYYKNSQITYISINDIVPNYDQPRTTFNEKALSELSQSIRIHGVLEPILVIREGIFFKIIAGERRFRAASMAGLTKIPAILIDGTQEQLREVAIIENLHRQQLNPIEEAEAVKILMETHNLTQEQISRDLGRSRPAIANLLRLLTLPMDIQIMLKEGKLSPGHARALMSIKNDKAMIVLANKCIENKWSVNALNNEIERLRKKSKNPPKKKPSRPSQELKNMVTDLERVFQTPITISGNDKKGKLVIEYKTESELNRLYEALEKLKNAVDNDQ